MKAKGQPDPAAAAPAAAKLFTVACGQEFAALAWPTVNNFG
jgi:hypothetical protein